MIRYVVQACRAPTCTRVRMGSRLRCVSHACRTRSRCLRPQARGTMASGGRLHSCRETGLSFVVCLSCGSLSFSLTLTNGSSYHLHTHTHTHTASFEIRSHARPLAEQHYSTIARGISRLFSLRIVSLHILMRRARSSISFATYLTSVHRSICLRRNFLL